MTSDSNITKINKERMAVKLKNNENLKGRLRMKKFYLIILFGLLLGASCIVYVPRPIEETPLVEEEQPPAPIVEREVPPSPAMDVSYFYDYLSPYGFWVHHPPYGFVWMPRDIWHGWRPYTYGRWVWTDFGWTWVSYFRWGWAPFHYGRWGWDRELGWFWTPDVLWGPGWVTWRSSHLYIGWAPLPPEAVFVVGFGIDRVPFSIPYHHWVFVEGAYFLDTSLHRHVFPPERNRTVINYTAHQTNIHVVNNRVVNRGVDVDQIRRVTRQQVSKVELRDAKKAGESRVEPGSVELYRPSINKSEAAKPKVVVDKREARERISRPEEEIVRSRVSPVPEERSIKEVHRREIRLVEQSQQRELQELEQKKEEEKASARTPEGKMKVEKEYNEKIAKVKKSHEEEKSEVKTRHKTEEEEQAKKVTPEKGKIKKKEKK